MTPKEYIHMNTDKDGKMNATAQKTLISTLSGFSEALAKTKDNLVKNPPSETDAYNGKYIDFRSAQDAITKAEQDASKDTLTHYMRPAIIDFDIPTQAGVQHVKRLGEETVLQYKWLTIPAGAVPIENSNSNNGRNQSSAGQTFGKSLTTAERQSLSMVFGIRHKSGNGTNGSSNSYSGGYSNNYHRSYNNYSRNYNNGGSRNFSQVGNHSTTNTPSNNGYSQPKNSVNANKKSTTTNQSSTTQNSSQSGKISVSQAKALQQAMKKVIDKGVQSKQSVENYVEKLANVKSLHQLNYLSLTTYNKIMSALKNL